jgi:hypothetical protein
LETNDGALEASRDLAPSESCDERIVDIPDRVLGRAYPPCLIANRQETLMSKKKLMTYEEMLEKYPDWLVIDTDAYWREETPELTEQSRLRVKRRLGVYLRFMQDHGLVRQVLCSSAPDIPDDFKVYLRDVTPEGYEFHRTGYSKWVDLLDRSIDSDPTDTKPLEQALMKLRASGAATS